MAYSQEIADAICARLAEGESLRKACSYPGMPAATTVLSWVDDPRYQAFAEQYARARAKGYEFLADEIMEIADTPQIGVKTVTDDKGTTVTEGDMLEHRKLRVDTRKWMLAKMLPKRFGERLELAGALTFKKQAADLSDDELAEIATRGKSSATDGSVVSEPAEVSEIVGSDKPARGKKAKPQ